MKSVADLSINRRSFLRSLNIALIALFIAATFLSFNNHPQASASYLQTVAVTSSTKVPSSDANPAPPVSWCPGCSS